MDLHHLRLLVFLAFCASAASGDHLIQGFVRVSGTRFILNDHPFYVNGFNAYWLSKAACAFGHHVISNFFKEAYQRGLTVGRTWSFNDLGVSQIKPGIYDETAFQCLDVVVAQARRHGLRLLLSLSDNYSSKSTYVKWAQDQGIFCDSDDDFFSNPAIKRFFTDYIQTLLTRVNTITGVAYRDDPTIFAWELMNEPRVPSDPSGDILEAWIREMSAFVKSIDNNHVLEIGMEGFYPQQNSGRTVPGGWTTLLGTDFIRHNLIPGIDFATAHGYAEVWLPSAGFGEQMNFLAAWVSEHIDDATKLLQKPVLFTEFGLSEKAPGYVIGQRDIYFNTMYSIIFASARNGGAAAGSLVWQLLTDGLNGLSDWSDGFQIFPSQKSSTLAIIKTQSQRMTMLNRAP